jgi:hypothetical protein
MEFVRTEVDGVPAVWVDGDRGPLRLGLAFRVGRADETLVRGGITHLIEHLALHRVGVADYHYNGATGLTVTTFVTSGNTDEVCRFVETVCGGLRDLPVDRVEVERSILRTEAAGRQRGAAERLALWRYGPASYGLGAYPEFGLDDHSVDDLRAWVDRWFTRGNAVVWCIGAPPPDGLRIDLPDGPRMPPPVATSALPRLPAYFSADVNGVAFDAVLPRSSAANMYAAILGRRLRGVLRQDLGISYTVGAEYERRDAEVATVTAVADSSSERRDRALGPFLDTFIDLATGVVTDEELRAVRSLAEDTLNDPGAAGMFAMAATNDILVEVEPQTIAMVRAGMAELTPDDIRAVARDALAAGLLMVPEGQAVGRAGFSQAPAFSADRVQGYQYALANMADDPRRLVVGEAGVSIVDGQNALTVMYADCAGMLAYPDGGRVLFAPDAVVVSIEPSLWTLTPLVMGRIDAAVPADRIAHLPERPPEAIPSPPTTPAPAANPPANAAATRAGSSPVRRAIAVLLIGLVATICLGFGAFALVDGHSIFILIGSSIAAAWLIRLIRSSMLPERE